MIFSFGKFRKQAEKQKMLFEAKLTLQFMCFAAESEE
jgi:hypothetical protein